MTSKDYLSQEEIDALLQQPSNINDVTSPKPEVTLNDYLTEVEQDALGEIGNITFGSAATALSTLLGQKVDITTPKLSLISRERFSDEFPLPHVAVHVNYVDGFEGVNSLVIRVNDAKIIANLMLGGDGRNIQEEELNEIHISAVQEAMNQMMGSSATSMSTIFNRFVNISPPGIDILDVEAGEGLVNLPNEDYMVKVSFRLIIGDLIDSAIMQLIPIDFAKGMVAILMGGGSVEDTPASSQASAAPQAMPAAEQLMNPQDGFTQVAASNPATNYQQPMQEQPMYQQPMTGQPMQQPMYEQSMNQQSMQQPMYEQQMNQQSMQQPMYQQPMYQQPMYQQPMYQQPMYQQPMQQAPMPDPAMNRNVQQVQFSGFQSSNFTSTEETNLNLLLDIPLRVTVELGRTQKQIKEILELSQGSIVELDKLAGEPVDILVNNKLIAKGEVVVIDENFGVRVTDIVSQWDRIQKLQ